MRIFIIFIIIFIIFIFIYCKKKDNYENDNEMLNIYIITMPSRRKHVEKFINSFKMDGDKIYIIDAIIEDDIVSSCKKSHLKVLNMIKDNKNNYKNIIFEDDVMIEKNSRPVISSFIDEMNDYNYDILYGGFYKEENPVVVSTINNYNIYKLSSPRTTHCYIINKDKSSLLIDIINKDLIDPIDEILAYAIYNNDIIAYGIYFFKQPWQNIDQEIID